MKFYIERSPKKSMELVWQGVPPRPDYCSEEVLFFFVLFLFLFFFEKFSSLFFCRFPLKISFKSIYIQTPMNMEEVCSNWIT